MIGPESKYLQSVIALWGTNRRFLGLYPKDAFLDRAWEPGILGYVSEQGNLLGYLLYYVTQRHIVRVVHLCVDELHRRHGVADALLDALFAKRRPRWRMIQLSCRKDYSATKLWPRHGFFAHRERIGRSKKKRLLVNWRFEFDPKDEFPSLEGLDRFSVVVDNNVFSHLHLPDPSHPDSSRLKDKWVLDQVNISVTPEHYNEVLRHDDTAFRSSRRRELAYYDHVTADRGEFQDAVRVLRDLFPANPNSSHQSDLNQVAWSVAGNASVFLTTDERLIKRAGQIEYRTGLIVARPCDFLVQLSRSSNDEYFRSITLGTAREITERRIDKEADIPWALIENQTGAKRKDLRSSIRDCLAAPAFFDVRVVESIAGEPLAFYIRERNGNVNRVYDLAVPNGKMAAPLIRRVLIENIRRALEGGLTGLVVSSAFDSSQVSDACRELGFQHFDDGYFKTLASGIRTVAELNAARIELSSCVPGVSIAAQANFNPGSGLEAATLEHRFWPAKVVESDVPTYLISIHPSYAQHLTDERLADRMLFAPDPELAINTEGVYYSAAKIQLCTPARILWYITKRDHIPESECISGCARLVETVSGTADELLRKFKRLGVFGTRQVRSLAKFDRTKRLQAFRFDDQETFPSPLPWKVVQPILAIHGYRGGPPVSPRKLSSNAFLDVYRAGNASRIQSPPRTA